MSAVIEAAGLGKRYRRKWALADCTLSIPAGNVVGLVGPNGAGKTTLLNLAVGLLAPDAGTIQVLGGPPGDRHVRDRDAGRRVAGRARAAAPRPGALAGQGTTRRAGR